MNEARQVEMENWVVDFIDERRKKNGMTIDQLAAEVYPGVPTPSARMRIQGLRKPQGANGKRKRLLYSEFLLMAKAVGLTPSEVVTLTSQAFEELRT